MSQSDSKGTELRDVPSLTMSQSDTRDTDLQDVSVKEKDNKYLEEYPNMQNRILVMIALYLSIFLVTLVWILIVFERRMNLLTTVTGPEHYLDGNSSNHGRVSLPG